MHISHMEIQRELPMEQIIPVTLFKINQLVVILLQGTKQINKFSIYTRLLHQLIVEANHLHNKERLSSIEQILLNICQLAGIIAHQESKTTK